MDDLRKLVSSSFTHKNNARFQLTFLPSLEEIDPNNPSHHLICAWDGHSLRLSPEGVMEPVDIKEIPDQLVHATSEENWQKILQSGSLKCPPERNSIHFLLESRNAKIKLPSGNIPVEKAVPGFRTDATILIWVDAKRSAKDGNLE